MQNEKLLNLFFLLHDYCLISRTSQALGVTIGHHLGTVAFGSLLIAIIRTIRTVVAYFQRKLKKQHNKLAEYVLCCVQCCLGCLERCIRFINKHAYIITAIYR